MNETILGKVAPVVVHDEVSNTHLVIRTSEVFTVITINGREFYFRQSDGDLDGTGSMMVPTRHLNAV